MSLAWVTDLGNLHMEGERPRKARLDASGGRWVVRRFGKWCYFAPTGRSDWGREGTMHEARLVATSRRLNAPDPTVKCGECGQDIRTPLYLSL